MTRYLLSFVLIALCGHTATAQYAQPDGTTTSQANRPLSSRWFSDDNVITPIIDSQPGFADVTFPGAQNPSFDTTYVTRAGNIHPRPAIIRGNVSSEGETLGMIDLGALRHSDRFYFSIEVTTDLLEVNGAPPPNCQSCDQTKGGIYIWVEVWNPLMTTRLDPIALDRMIPQISFDSGIGSKWNVIDLSDRLPTDQEFRFQIHWSDPDDTNYLLKINGSRMLDYSIQYGTPIEPTPESQPYVLYPNPVRVDGMARLQGWQAGDRWAVYDLLGRRLAQGETEHVSMRGLTAGAYLVRVFQAGTTARSLRLTVR